MRLLAVRPRLVWVDAVALAVVGVVFVVPFVFIFLTAAKDQLEASSLDFSWPTDWQLVENLRHGPRSRNGLVITALRNSMLLTVGLGDH